MPSTAISERFKSKTYLKTPLGAQSICQSVSPSLHLSVSRNSRGADRTSMAYAKRSLPVPAPSFPPPSLASLAGRQSSHLKSRVSRKGSKSATDRCVPHVSPFGHVPRLEVKA